MNRLPLFRAKMPLKFGLAGGGTNVGPYSDTHSSSILNITIPYNLINPLKLKYGGEFRKFTFTDYGLKNER